MGLQRTVFSVYIKNNNKEHWHILSNNVWAQFNNFNTIVFTQIASLKGC